MAIQPWELMLMTEFTCKLAGKVVAVQALHPSTRSYCAQYLCDEKADFSVSISQQCIELERQIAAREDQMEGLPVRQLPDLMLELTAVQRKITENLIEYDTLLFHGSVVAVDGQAYLFTAKSGTGKSTHTRLWREVFGQRAVMVNDDKPFLRLTDRGVLVCGSPWMGKHGLGGNIQLPLKAICVLERGEENRIRSITPQEVLPMLFQQSQRPAQPRLLPRYMALVDRLAAGVNFYRMQCNMDPQAAQVAYSAMSGAGE